jgi:probable rRNA maturation factor
MPHVEVVTEVKARFDLETLQDSVAAALTQHGVDGEVSVLLTSDERIQAMNSAFRSMEEPTDVLTFPAAPSDAPYLGDVAISVEYAARQAAIRGITVIQEICYLGIHGALHLVGFDDTTDTEREAMQHAMSRAAEAAGLPADPEWTSLLHEQGEQSA